MKKGNGMAGYILPPEPPLDPPDDEEDIFIRRQKQRDWEYDNADNLRDDRDERRELWKY